VKNADTTPATIPFLPALRPVPAELPALLEIFSQIPALTLRQSWLPAPEPGFLPASARTAHNGTHLIVLAELPDDDIFTLSTGPNQKTWELGDVFEIFLQPAGAEHYFELHTTPANTRTQFRLAKPGATLEPLPDGTFASCVWKSETRWHTLVETPLTLLGTTAPTEVRLSFSRYDAFRTGRPPILSSTSPHPVPKFHRPAEWLPLRIEP
jgi:hypothetical protein